MRNNIARLREKTKRCILLKCLRKNDKKATVRIHKGFLFYSDVRENIYFPCEKGHCVSTVTLFRLERMFLSVPAFYFPAMSFCTCCFKISISFFISLFSCCTFSFAIFRFLISFAMATLEVLMPVPSPTLTEIPAFTMFSPPPNDPPMLNI